MIQGKRHDLIVGDPFELEMGQYGKTAEGTWYVRLPAPGFPMLANLTAHTITEHEDGTITVSPSILVTGHSGKQWHGYLERGIWREV